MTFRKLAALTTDVAVVQEALVTSALLELNDTRDAVRRREALPQCVIDIPSDVPCGMVIGKGGAMIKSLGRKHHVHAFVDDMQRTVSLTGPEMGVIAAIKDLDVTFHRIQQHLNDQLIPGSGSKTKRGANRLGHLHSNAERLIHEDEQTTKEIRLHGALPDALVGHKDALAKGISLKYNLMATVEASQRQLVLIGSLDRMDEASQEVEALLARLQMTEDSTSSSCTVAVRDGPAFTWRLAPVAWHPRGLDPHEGCFELLKCNASAKSDDQSSFERTADMQEKCHSWIQTLDAYHLASLSQQLIRSASQWGCELRSSSFQLHKRHYG